MGANANGNADGYQDECRIGRTADYCAYLHRAVTQEQCAACWLRWQADPDLRLAGRDALATIGGGLWDECRGKHLEREADERRA